MEDEEGPLSWQKLAISPVRFTFPQTIFSEVA
jgi:hypothetical protein